MTEKQEMMARLRKDFTDVGNILTAIGDETRQMILLVLMTTECSEGLRVGEIQAQTHLSRPAVSHQIKILKDLGLVKCRKEGTMNFYYIDVSNNRQMFGKLKKLVFDIDVFMNTMENPKAERNTNE